MQQTAGQMAASAGASAAAAAYSTNATTGGADTTEAAHTEAKAETPIPPAGTSSARKGVPRFRKCREEDEPITIL